MCIPHVFRMSQIHRPIHPPLFDYVHLARISLCEVPHCGCHCLPPNFSEVPKNSYILLSHTLSLFSYGEEHLLGRPLIYASEELSCTVHSDAYFISV